MHRVSGVVALAADDGQNLQTPTAVQGVGQQRCVVTTLVKGCVVQAFGRSLSLDGRGCVLGGWVLDDGNVLRGDGVGIGLKLRSERIGHGVVLGVGVGLMRPLEAGAGR